MIFKNSLSTQLHERREEFLSFDRMLRRDLSECARHLASLGHLGSQEIKLRAGVARAPGATPSRELDEARSTIIPLKIEWRSHEEARRWALEILFDRVTGAADGSQYLPGREITLPVAAVQVAFFENPHTREGRYIKEASLALVTPAEIMQAGMDVDSLVGFRRFQEEVRVLQDFLERHRGWRERGLRMPVGFFDGTLLISYARPRNKVQDRYVDTVVELVEHSRETGVPLVGYIDYSYARDLVNLLEALGEWKSTYGVYDAQILRAALEAGPLLKSWGDRTSFFYCEREGLGDDFLDENGDPLWASRTCKRRAMGCPRGWIFPLGYSRRVCSRR